MSTVASQVREHGAKVVFVFSVSSFSTQHDALSDGLIVSHMPYGPTAFFSLTNVVMRHDIPDAPPVSEAFPHLIFHNFTTPLGHRVRTRAYALSQLLRVCACTCACACEFVSVGYKMSAYFA